MPKYERMYNDLLELYNQMDDIEYEMRLTSEERKYREELIELCEQIAMEYGNNY